MATPHAPETAAGLLPRATAFALDSTLLFLGILLTQGGLYLLREGWEEPGPSGPQLSVYLLFTVSVPVWLYFLFMESSRRKATFGKRLLRLEVADAYGSRISMARSAWRTLVKLIPWELTHLTLCLPTPIFYEGSDDRLRPGFWFVYGLIGLYLTAAMITRRKQSVHDLAAGTYVIRAA
jgi:uncharacterized RDD family membrane protein YckC